MHNPVNWRAWGDDVFQTARKEDKPVLFHRLLHRHWCHVMERESFEDEERCYQSKLSPSADREEAQT